MLIAEYPMPKERMLTSDSNVGTDVRYWSAYVHIENQDIPDLWKVSDLDYAIISVEASIPTRTGAVVRTIPLFTVERGAPQAESGVDLLKKLPLTAAAREQVTFKLKVTYLKDEQALKVARSILDRMAKLAEPFLSSYPVASQIIESSLDLINDAVKTENRPVSSLVSVVVPEDLYEDFENDSSMLRVFFFLPINLRETSVDSDTQANEGGAKGRTIRAPQPDRRANADASTDATSAPSTDTAGRRQCRLEQSIEACGVKNWVRLRLGIDEDKRLVECSDMPGRLCLTAAPAGEREQQLIEFVHAANNTHTYDYTLESALREVQRYKGVAVADWLYVEDLPAPVATDLRTRLTALKTAEENIDAKCNVSELPDECFTLWVDYDREYTVTFETLETVVDELIRSADEGSVYAEHRLDTIVYVTIKFTPYPNVFDPLVLLPGVSDSCNDLDETTVESVQSYFASNVDFFTEGDGDKIRQMLRMARDYIRLHELMEREAYSEALRILTNLESQRNEIVHESKILLDAQISALDRCFDDLQRHYPLQQYLALWRIAHPLPSSAPVSQKQRSIPERPEPRETRRCPEGTVQRLDMIDQLLRQLAIGANKSIPNYEKPSDVHHGLERGSEFIALLIDEGRRLLAYQEKLAKGMTCGPELLASLSNACEKCYEELEKRCKAELTPLQIAQHRETARQCTLTKIDELVD